MNLFSPAEIARNYIATGKAKVSTPIPKMLLLAVMAGAFIAIGGIASTTAAVSIPKVRRRLRLPRRPHHGSARGK